MNDLYDIEARIDETRRRITAVDERTYEKFESLKEMEMDRYGIRRRIAQVLIQLGARIDQEALEALRPARHTV